MSTPAVRGPVPPFSNVNIMSQNYNPNAFFISSITLGTMTTITTTKNHNFVVAQLVRLLIPPQFGCRQLNEITGYVLSIPALNQVVLTIDSSHNVDPFVSSSASNQPQILPVGDVNNGVTNSSGRSPTGTSIPGSFINVSP